MEHISYNKIWNYKLTDTVCSVVNTFYVLIHFLTIQHLHYDVCVPSDAFIIRSLYCLCYIVRCSEYIIAMSFDVP